MTDYQHQYQQQYRQSLSDPSQYWLKAAADVHWFKPPTQGVDTTRSPFNRWFSDGQMNASYNALDHQVALGRGEQAAIIYDSPMTGTQSSYTYQQLLNSVELFAGVLAAKGVQKGDRVLIYQGLVEC